MIKHTKKYNRSVLLRCVRHIRRPFYLNAAGYRVYLATALLLFGCGKSIDPIETSNEPQRLVSLAPNITEMICALELNDRLVGVTTYCTYPDFVRELPKTGGFGQINYEAIVTLNPDLVLLHRESEAEIVRLNGLGIPTLETGSTFIADILASIHEIGAACGVPDRAETLIQSMETSMTEIRNAGQSSQSTPPRVLILFGGDTTGPFQAFGPACLHNELLEIAGGQNVIEGTLPFATLSHEAVIRLNPDLMIILAPELKSADDYTRDWSPLGSVHAVQQNRIHVLTTDYTCIPGPRFIQTLEIFAEIIGQNHLEAE